MSEMIDLAYDSAKEDMQKAMDRLDTELGRSVRARPTSMLDSVKVDYYGALTPLNQVGNVSTTDLADATVQAYEKSMLDPIAMAITNANLGLNPMNNGEVLITSVPAHRGASAIRPSRPRRSVRTPRCPSECTEGRQRRIKATKDDGASEDAIKAGEANVQTLTNDYSKQVDDRISAKEADITTV